MQQVLRTGRVGRDERQIDLGLEQRGKLHLGLFRRFLETLQRHLVLRKIDALFLLEFGDDPVHHALVDVVAAEVGVTVCRFHFHHAVAHFEDRDVERAAAEVIDGDGFVLLLVETVGERRRRRLIDDAFYIQPGDFASVFSRLALGVVEICRNRDHRLGDLLAEVRFGRFLQLGEDHRRDLGRRILLAHDLDARVTILAPHHFIRDHLQLFADFVDAASHEPLDRENRVFGIRDRLALGDLSNQPLAGFGKRHYRRGRAGTFLIRDNRGLSALHHRDDELVVPRSIPIILPMSF